MSNAVESPLPGNGSIDRDALNELQSRIDSVDGVSYLDVSEALTPYIAVRDGDQSLIDALAERGVTVAPTDSVTRHINMVLGTEQWSEVCSIPESRVQFYRVESLE